MIRNYLLSAWRNLVRNKVYAAINILGLAIGITCCLLIFLYVRASLSYDTHHSKADRIYRGVWQNMAKDQDNLMAFLPSPITAAAKEFPEVEQAARLMAWPHTLVEHGQKRFYEENFFLADSSLLDILTLPLLHGDAGTALDAPDAVIISEAAASKLFGTENPIGKVITVSKEINLKVTGVMAKTETPSHLQADYIASFGQVRIAYGERLESWGWNQFYTYLLLSKQADPVNFEAKFNQYLVSTVLPSVQMEGVDFRMRLQPVKDIYLHSSEIQADRPNRGNSTYVYAFVVVALFILAIACLNFMNLTTAQSLKRAKEVGIRKVIGAHRKQLVFQFLGESTLLTLFSFVLALLLTELSIGYFSRLSGENLSLQYPYDLLLVLVLLLASVPVGLLAGVYPAFFLSAFMPVEVLKGGSAKGYRLSAVRKGLVVTQFAISIALVSATLVVYRQLHYLNNKSMGFDNEQTLVLQMEGDKMQQGFENFKTELRHNPNVLNVAASYGVLAGKHPVGDAVYLEGRKDPTSVSMFIVDHDYIETMKLKVLAGRNFSREFATDLDQAFIINETAAREFGFGKPEDAIGKPMGWDRWTEPRQLMRGKVVGVVKDFHSKSLHQKIEPTVLLMDPANVWWLTVRLHPEEIPSSLAFLENKWKEYAPGYPFDYFFLDDAYANLYVKEQKMSQVFTLFSLLAVAIACMGLLGLVAFAAEQRTKEIGIRKTLGASILQILMLLSRDFAKLVLVAVLIATPITWYGMNQWLQNYAYRIEISWWIFALAGLSALLIAMLTVSLQTIKIASINPIKSLRTE